MADKSTEKELEYFRKVTYTSPDNYLSYRRLTEFRVQIAIAEEDFLEELSLNILNQDAPTQTAYLQKLIKKIKHINLDRYADLAKTMALLEEFKLEWSDLDKFYRTLRDFFILEMTPEGGIGYHNKEPNIPTDYDSPAMAFLNKGIGFMTAEDVADYKIYNEKYGKYTYDSWDVHQKDILPEARFLELLQIVWSAIPKIDIDFPKSSAGEVEDKLNKLKCYIFNGIQKKSIKSVDKVINDTKKTLMSGSNTPKFENFEIFIKSFEYNYPLELSVVSYIYQWQSNLEYLQKEILDNLITLNDQGTAAYLKRIRFDCEKALKNAHTPRETIITWVEKYKTSLSEAFDHSSFMKSDLNNILNSEVPKFHATFEDGFNVDTEAIQHDFYNFNYGEILTEAISFIDSNLKNSSGSSGQASTTKLKTTLTVPQLSYFFNLLMEEKLIDYKHKTEVYSFISQSFQTNNQNSISADSVKNNMDNPKLKDVKSIREKLMHLLQISKVDEENL